jgi:serine/threonine protein kinase
MIFHKFPFKGQDHDETKKLIISQTLKFKSSRKVVSKDCQDLLLKLLDKNPHKRIDLLEAKTHPWFQLSEEELKT